MSHQASRRVNLTAIAAQLLLSAMVLAGCAGIGQPAYVEDSPKAKTQNCQSPGQNTQDCQKPSTTK
jgi:PBP1b-binding outer membrane lipoprotein LpoB